MTKSQIAEALQEIATLLELKDEDALAKIPGIGKSIAEKIKELAGTGSIRYREKLLYNFPAAILELFSIPGLGAKKIKALHEQLHISSIEQLLAACQSGQVAKLPGFGETTQEKLCQAIEKRAQHAGAFQFGQIAAEAESLKSDLAAHPEALHVDLAGSYRRRREIVRDLDFIVATKKPDAITRFLVDHPLVESVIAQGPTKTSVRLRSGIQCDLRVVTSDEYPFALNYFTGSKEHNIEMRSRALHRGWTLNEYRLAPLPPDPKSKKVRAGRAIEKRRKKIPKVRDEAELYHAL